MKPKVFKIDSKVRVFEETARSEDEQPIVAFDSTCCAMSTLSLKNYHSLEDIKSCIDFIKKDSNSRTYSPVERNWGERNLQVITCDFETNLKDNLKKLGFKSLTKTMTRRLGYAKGNLELFMLSF